VAVSDLIFIVVVAVITYLSRAAGMVLLPAARGYLLGLVTRIPAPLFAGLAVFAFVGDEVLWPGPSTIAAVVAALLASPKRSLGLTLAAGIVGFVVVELLV
jgi:branched-subunit amino acid transport protein AzlD